MARLGTKANQIQRPTCNDFCVHLNLVNDGVCNDGGFGDEQDDNDGKRDKCALGTDCSDCMRVSQSFFEPNWETDGEFYTWFWYADWVGATAILVVIALLSGFWCVWLSPIYRRYRSLLVRRGKVLWTVHEPTIRRVLPHKMLGALAGEVPIPSKLHPARQRSPIPSRESGAGSATGAPSARKAPFWRRGGGQMAPVTSPTPDETPQRERRVPSSDEEAVSIIQVRATTSPQPPTRATALPPERERPPAASHPSGNDLPAASHPSGNDFPAASQPRSLLSVSLVQGRWGAVRLRRKALANLQEAKAKKLAKAKGPSLLTRSLKVARRQSTSTMSLAKRSVGGASDMAKDAAQTTLAVGKQLAAVPPTFTKDTASMTLHGLVHAMAKVLFAGEMKAKTAKKRARPSPPKVATASSDTEDEADEGRDDNVDDDASADEDSDGLPAWKVQRILNALAVGDGQQTPLPKALKRWSGVLPHRLAVLLEVAIVGLLDALIQLVLFYVDMITVALCARAPLTNTGVVQTVLSPALADPCARRAPLRVLAATSPL